MKPLCNAFSYFNIIENISSLYSGLEQTPDQYGIIQSD